MKPTRNHFLQILATHRCQAPRSKEYDYEQCTRGEVNGVTCGIHAVHVTSLCADAVRGITFPQPAKHENCRNAVDGNIDHPCVCPCHANLRWQQ